MHTQKLAPYTLMAQTQPVRQVQLGQKSLPGSRTTVKYVCITLGVRDLHPPP